MIILCGGLAKRLGSLAKAIPKSMIDVNGKPFIEHQINYLKKQDIKDIILCVGHLSKKITDYFQDGSKFNVKIKYSFDGDKQLGPIGALKKAEPLLEKEFFTMYGDSYLTIDFKKFYNFYKQYDKPACIAVYKNQNKYDKSNLIVKDKMVTGCGDKDRSQNMTYIDYGTSIFKKTTLKLVPENTYFSTSDFFTELIKRNELLAYEVKNRFYHIGNPEALEEFRAYIKG
jgi:NDP-sugar pyrophosphorylase family protein